MTFADIPQGEKHVIDVLSVGTLAATLANYLPHVAAVLTIIWTGIRIYETPTVQKLLGKNPKQVNIVAERIED